MLRGAEQKYPPRDHAHAVSPARDGLRMAPKTLLQRQPSPLERRTGAAKVLGFCGWVLAGGTALFAIWELGNFSVLMGGPEIGRDSPAPGIYRPAGGSAEPDSGCTQAPIDRANGQTTPGDCHTSRPPGANTMTAGLGTGFTLP